ncbi:putative quinol monooxygenase [Methanosphaera sp.]
MIIVNASLKPKEGKTEDIIKEANTLIAASRTHHGNVSYNLYNDVESDDLMFVEKWESKEALQQHMMTEEFKDFGIKTKELIDGDLDVKIYYGELLSNSADVNSEVKEITILYK